MREPNSHRYTADHENADANPSGNEHFDRILERALPRRELLRGSLGLAIGSLFAGGALARSVDWTDAEKSLPARAGKRPGFRAVPVTRADRITVPEGYRAQVILPWGEPILGRYPEYLEGGFNTAQEQAEQMGMHHDGMHFFPLFGRNDHGLLVVNHEYVAPEHLHPGGPVLTANARPAEQVAKEIAAHGVSVVEIRRVGDLWTIVRGKYNRRITGDTPMLITGPVRASAHVVTAFDPAGERARGTLNNCAGGSTPWGTYLTCEENWAGYFVNHDAEQPREHARYGLPDDASNYLWETVDARWNASTLADSPRGDYRNEPNTFGWVVEINPFAPDSTPRKRTALGRFGHEAATVAPPRIGHPYVVYMGDDARNEYIYKFVSRQVHVPVLSSRDALENGTLYVARFHDDGTGEWLALDIDDPVFRAAAVAAGVEFEDQADVLVNTRLAADVIGATPMDRPEWAAVDPDDGLVYVALTNNTRRGEADVDPANPRGPNAYGHIIRWREDGDDHAALRFRWDIFVLSGPASDSARLPSIDGAALGAEAIHASPDGLWFDRGGMLWIQTDMSGSQLGEGPFGNNQMLAADPSTGEIRRFLVGPVGCEVTGISSTPDLRTLFVNIQHPDDGSNWPDGGDARPRSATVVITREDGGLIGR